jgi:hypothetical protein
MSEDGLEATKSSVVALESSVITDARELLAEATDEDNENLDIFGIVNTQLKGIKKLKDISAPYCIKMTIGTVKQGNLR